MSMPEMSHFSSLLRPPRRARLRGWAVVLGLVLVLAPGHALAQGNAGDLWQTFTVSDGMLSNNVLAVFVARDGTLWFGSEGGASHYNGSWEWLTPRDGLPAGRVRAIAQAADGTLWFAIEAGGLARRGANGACCKVWTEADGLPSNDVRALWLDRQGTLWIGTTAGLAYYDGTRVRAVSDIPPTLIWAITEGPEGRLWVGATSQGVWERDAAGMWRLLDQSALVRGTIYALWGDQAGRIWAGTQEGLVYYQEGSWQRQPLLGEDRSLRVFALVADRDGRLWVGTDQGVFYSQGPYPSEAPFAHIAAGSKGLVHQYVRAMAVDQDGALWMGTIAGVSRYAGGIWSLVSDPILQGQRVNSVLTDKAGRVWAGTEQNGLAMWDGTRWLHYTDQNGLPDNRVVTLFEDSQGRVWVATGTDVGYRLEGDDGWHFFGAPAGIIRFPVYAFAQDNNGRLWLASEGGLSRWDEANGFQPVSELAGKRVNAIHRARDGVLWCGTDRDGLLRLVYGEWQPVNGPGGTPFNLIVTNGIAESPDGTLWVGTYGDGLWQYRDQQWQRIDAALSSPLILSVKFTGDSLWVGTRVGLDRFDTRTWQSYTGDALPNPEVLAIAPGAEGELWIGTKGGLVRYRPERTAPWVRVETVNLLRPINGSVRLTSDTLQAVRLVGGDLSTRPEHLIYLSQLVGVDREPQVHDSALISFGDRGLAPGSYLLRVQARDTSFNYSAVATVTIIVPRVVRLPGGRVIPAETFYPMLAFGLLALGGLATAGGISWRTHLREQERQAALAARRREALERHFNPYISGEPVRQEEMFFGRDELLSKILNALHQNSIMIHGERRIGKTSLLYQLAEALRKAEDPEWVFIPVSIDLEGTPEAEFFYLLMDAIWGVLRAYLAGEVPNLYLHTVPATEYTDRHFMADLKALLEPLKAVAAPRNVRIILLLDEMDVVNGYSSILQQQLRRIFMSSLAENLGAVVAGVQISKAWDRIESPWYNLFNEVPLEPFTDDQARELLVEPVRGVYEWDEEAIQFVIAQAQGRPHRLQQYALEAVNHMLGEKRFRITLADVQAAHELLERTRGD